MRRAARLEDRYPQNVASILHGSLDGWRIPEDVPQVLTGAVLPQGPWSECGRVLARTLHTLIVRANPRTVVWLQESPSPAADMRALLFPVGRWETPVGAVDVDASLARALRESLTPLLQVEPDEFEQDLEFETVLPALAHLAPGIRMVPILIGPELDAVDFGNRLGRVLQKDAHVMVVAGTALTRYGERFSFVPAGVGETGETWLIENDARMIYQIQSLNAEQILTEGPAQRNATEPLAVAAAVAAARTRDGWSGHLIEYTSSHRESDASVFDGGVGYAGLVF